MKDERDDIERYRNGTMSGAERNALEKRALDDPFLADALEGAESVTPEEFASDLKEIHRKLPREQSTFKFTPLRIAAGIVLLLGVGSVIYLFNSDEQTLITQQKSSPAPAATDSSLIAKGDTTSPNLLSLSKPEQNERSRRGSGPVETPRSDRAASGASARWDTLSTAGTAAQRRKAEAQPSIVAKPAEEKGEEKEAELATDEAKIAAAEPAKSVQSKDDVQLDRKASAKRLAVVPVDTITGTVTSAEDGSIIPGVNVVVKGTNQGVTTDNEGKYQLPVPATNQQIVFSFMGLRSQEVSARSTPLDVRLEEDVSQLSEVVVKGIDPDRDRNKNKAASKTIVRLAAPVGGMQAYNRYLKDNIRYPKQALDNKIKGKVTVKFTVKTDGNLSEFNIVKGIGHGCDEEVIRLVKEGPKWRPSFEDDVAIESEVRVKMKFDPDKVGKQ